jgi:hypothetical protein
MTTLETLLVAIRDGTAGPEVLSRARELASADERIPEELRAEVLLDPEEADSDAAGLLAVLGADNLGELIISAVMEEIESTRPQAQAEPIDPADLEFEDAWTPIGAALREGLLEEARHFEIADAVMRRIPVADFPWGPVLAQAVAAEAGTTDVAAQVLHGIGRVELSALAPVAEAVRAEAGSVDVAGSVITALGLTAQLPVAEAIRAEAGSVDVVDRVMLLVAPQEQLAAANYRWVYASLLMAAVTLLVVVTGRLATPVGGSVERMQFARASEVIVEDLHMANDVELMVLEGDDGAVIIWFDEEA